MYTYTYLYITVVANYDVIETRPIPMKISEFYRFFLNMHINKYIHLYKQNLFVFNYLSKIIFIFR